jgi:hypothetical protein
MYRLLFRNGGAIPVGRMTLPRALFWLRSSKVVMAIVTWYPECSGPDRWRIVLTKAGLRVS